jgi:hypothetical protein
MLAQAIQIDFAARVEPESLLFLEHARKLLVEVLAVELEPVFKDVRNTID